MKMPGRISRIAHLPFRHNTNVHAMPARQEQNPFGMNRDRVRNGREQKNRSALKKGEQMTRAIRAIVCTLSGVTLVGVGAAWAAPQGNQQQHCINALNKDTIKVEAAQGKLGSGCVKDAVKTGSNAETCLNADAKGKVG